MAACFKGTTKASKHPSRARVTMTTPVKVGLFGGRGTTDNDINPNQLPRALEKIEIWSSADGPGSGGVIRGIRFTYVDTSGKRNVIPSLDGAWGTPDGTRHEFKVATGGQEFVKKIGGSIGTAPDGDLGITSLSFTTSLGKTATYGDPKNGTAFVLPLENAGIFAFFTSSSTYLNAVGFYVQPYP